MDENMVPIFCDMAHLFVFQNCHTASCHRLNHMHLHDAQRALQQFAQTGARYLLTNVRLAWSNLWWTQQTWRVWNWFGFCFLVFLCGEPKKGQTTDVFLRFGFLRYTRGLTISWELRRPATRALKLRNGQSLNLASPFLLEPLEILFRFKVLKCLVKCLVDEKMFLKILFTCHCGWRTKDLHQVWLRAATLFPSQGGAGQRISRLRDVAWRRWLQLVVAAGVG